MRLRLVAFLLALPLFGCGGGDSGSPSAPSPTPTPTTFSLTGTVVDARNGSPINGATVTLQDGPNAGTRATANGSGTYVFSSLQRAGFTASASAQYYVPLGKGVDLTANRTVDYSLQYIEPFSRSGTGDNVFDMPQISRVRITGDYTRNSSNFVVYIAGRLVVNELLGTGWGNTHFEGTYLTSGGTVEIQISSGVRWAFFEVR